MTVIVNTIMRVTASIMFLIMMLMMMMMMMIKVLLIINAKMVLVIKITKV